MHMGVVKAPKIKILKFLKNAGPTTINCGISKIEDGEFIPFKKKTLYSSFFGSKKRKNKAIF
jgi:hypothetical protein